jgi:hypothetical protein
LHWPEPIEAPVRFALRIPPRDVPTAVAKVGALDGHRSIASFGVGEVIVGSPEPDAPALLLLRSWAESVGGSLVLLDAPHDMYADVGAWGRVPASVEIQRRVKAMFDPAGICNPGILPGAI